MAEKKATTGFLGSIEEVRWDIWLAAATIGLVVFGLVIVYSASGYVAQERLGNPHHFVMRQAMWSGLGLLAMLIAMRVDYRHYWNPTIVYGLLLVSIAMLVAVLFFNMRKGAHRWLSIGGFSAQPSEFAKIALTIFLARFLAVRESKGEIEDFSTTLLPASVIAGILAALILAEPDLGTTLMLGLIFLAMMFVSGTRVWQLFLAAPLALVVFYFYVVRVPWRWERIKVFLDPESDPLKGGFQNIQAKIAVGSGGLYGLGLGEGKQKMMYLPEPHADFIFAVIGEELGLIGAITVVLVFGLLLYRGLLISRCAPDRFGQLLAVGLTVMLIAQAFFNISVVLGLVPNKGIPLPFISAGGSSLLFALAAVGVLLNISAQRKAKG